MLELEILVRGRSQDGGGIGRGDHFLSYKFIERTIERWTKFTKQLLIASRGHQAPRKGNSGEKLFLKDIRMEADQKYLRKSEWDEPENHILEI